MDAKRLLEEIARCARTLDFEIESYGEAAGAPLVGLTRQSATGPNVYISGGVHGDEPAGTLALLELLRTDALPRTCSYWICPLVNPGGLAAGTRENPDGIDLNRDYEKLQSEEVRAHTGWIFRRLQRLDLSLHLHEDWESTGFYLYELNLGPKPGCAASIIDAVRGVLPIETAEEIDGNPACGGVIRPTELPEVPGGDPEAICLKRRLGGLNYTLETPSALSLASRVAAQQVAVQAAIDAIQL